MVRSTQPKTPKQRIFVGLSGGVDSAVSAALLQKAGHDVTGVFIKVWQPDWIECNWKDERLEAMRVAAHLEIPFVTLDLEQEYKRGVIDYMIAEYAAGRTPNPDVMCNREVKFGAFWQWAKKQGADAIATGHYAQISDRNKGDMLELLAGTDTNKDQSYFLWTLNQDDLSHTFFPVGGYEKPEVRKLALKFKLPNAGKKDSQGLCFIGKVDVKEFLKHYIHAESGDVLNEAGDIIGTHSGAMFLTIGERHGFTVDPAHKTSNDKPYYVVAKDVKANTVTVSNKDTANSGMKKMVRISHVNWILKIPNARMKVSARGRYRAPLQSAVVTSKTADTATLEFAEPQDALTPGQSLVIYDGDITLGGGIIEA